MERAVTLMTITLAVAFAAVAAALIRPARWWRVAVFAAVSALAAWPAVALYAWGGLLGLITLPVGAAAAVAAARDTSLRRLLFAAVAGAVLILPGYLFLYFAGIGVGGAMTALAGNPPVNAADEDLSLTFAALLLGLLLAALNRWITGPSFRPLERLPTPDPVTEKVRTPTG